MIILYKLFILRFLVNYSLAQQNDIFGALMNGVDTGINIFRNSLDAGMRTFLGDVPSVNIDMNMLEPETERFNNNQYRYEPEEPNSNFEQHPEEDSKENLMKIDPKKEKENFPYNHQQLQKQQNISRSPNRQAGPKQIAVGKSFIDKIVLVKNHDLDPIEKQNANLTNKENVKPNVTTILNDITNKTSPLVIVVNSTVIENTLSKAVNNGTINHNSTQTINDKIKKDRKKILKPISKRKFYFQVRPVTPMNNATSGNETIYYIDK